MNNKAELAAVVKALKEYDGPEMSIMEICGTHTASIAREGIPSILSDRIHLISGPGCPVCVTVTSYIDRLVELAGDPDKVIVSFGDLLRVPGSVKNLSEASAEGADVRMVYSPAQMLDLAAAEPGKTFIFAAVGFETTTPVYAMMLEEADRRGLKNVRLACSLKVMPPVIDWIMNDKTVPIGGFIAPGHVCSVTGSDLFVPLAERYQVPFVVSGFSGPQILCTIYRLLQLRGMGQVDNLYRGVVTAQGNRTACAVADKYFEPCDAAWRGMGVIRGSGRKLRPEYSRFDAGCEGLTEDHTGNGCRCAYVLTGRIRPAECPMFGRACTPRTPQGACMVSQEGSCFNYFVSGRRGR